MSGSSRMSTCNGEEGLEKQMGCMSGFFQLFDRHHMHPAKRIYDTKRLNPSPDIDSSSFSSSSSGKLAVSPVSTPELHQDQQLKSSPECLKSSAISLEIKTTAEGSGRMTRPFAVFDLKEGSRSPAALKFREFPRLSLDSRAVVDGKGSLRPREIRTTAPFFSENQCDEAIDKQRRSPSVIARLMGLEALPEPGGGNRDEEDEHFQMPELRRSASESRSRDLMQYHNQYSEGKNLQQKQQEKKNFGANATASVNAEGRHSRLPVRRPTAVMEFSNWKPISEPAKAADEGFPSAKSRQHQQRKSFFDSQEFYPEAKQTTRSLYGEIEKRLKLRGIDEPEKDLETLKQILEALQLKGLLHSNNKSVARQIGNHQRNFVFDKRFSSEDSQIIVIQPSRFPSSPTRPVRAVTSSTQSNNKSKGGNHRKLNLLQNRPDSGRNSPDNQRIRNNPTMSPDRSPSSLIRRNPKPPLTIETQIRRGNESRISTTTAQSPKITTRSPKNNITINNNKNSINRRRNSRQTADSSSETHQKSRVPCVAEDELSSISESCMSSTPPQINATELRRAKAEEEKSLLERCDELLHNIAEMNSTTESQQPSPVSVLDSSFYKDASSPPPVLNLCLPFIDRSVELEDENWSASPVIAPLRCKSPEQYEYSIQDSDFLYVSEVLQTMDCVSDDSELFFLLETQQYKSDSSYVSRLHRKLIFDAVAEIIDKKRQLPPWKAAFSTDPTTGKPWLHEIWSELLRFRESRLVVECGRLLGQDMAGDSTNGWRDCPILMSEVVFDVEKNIFKDLIGETIRDLAGKHRACVSRRMLMF